ncbi:MAG TPA: hypothetical protein VHA11_08730 [Bryobacteraceae bacterium]|nr:hypothetical protein [Bryobacteraceae bacterium]
MRSATAGQSAEAAARILYALRAENPRRLALELDRAAGLARPGRTDSWAEEQAELLEGLVAAIREHLAAGGSLGRLESQAGLLSHLAGLD